MALKAGRFAQAPLGAVLCLALAGACSSLPFRPSGEPAAPLEDLETSLFLIGDAGAPARKEPVLLALSKKHEPLIYASGHEHNLQVLKGKNVKYVLVSGAGYFGHVSRTVWSEATAFAREGSGFMRLDVGRKGKVWLGVLTVDASGKATEAFSVAVK